MPRLACAAKPAGLTHQPSGAFLFMARTSPEEIHEESLPIWELLNLQAGRLSRSAETMRRASRMIEKGNEITMRVLDENKSLRKEIEELKGGK